MPPENQKTHNELYRELGAAHQQIENVEVAVEELKKSFGTNHDLAVSAVAVLTEVRKDFKTFKTELTTRLDRLETKISSYDILKAQLQGMVWAVSTIAAVVSAFIIALLNGDIAHWIKRLTA